MITTRLENETERNLHKKLILELNVILLFSGPYPDQPFLFALFCWYAPPRALAPHQPNCFAICSFHDTASLARILRSQCPPRRIYASIVRVHSTSSCRARLTLWLRRRSSTGAQPMSVPGPGPHLPWKAGVSGSP
jgi:hypothetical protein